MRDSLLDDSNREWAATDLGIAGGMDGLKGLVQNAKESNGVVFVGCIQIGSD